MQSVLRGLLVVTLLGASPAVVPAGFFNVTVTVENLAPADSVSFAPLRLGFHNGTFDAFNNGEAATAPIISVAEGGSGADWFPAFSAAEPNATLGSVGGALLPGTTAVNTFTVDAMANPYFTFATMVIPSNDHFLGNDSPTRFQLFDAAGNLLLGSITQQARSIWDAGSEATDPAHAAFLVGGNNDLRTPQNGVVSFNFSELSQFNGKTTAAGYVFNSQLSADTDIYRITFSAQPVPEPSSVLLAILGTVGMVAAGRLVKRKEAVETDGSREIAR